LMVILLYYDPELSPGLAILVRKPRQLKG